MNMYESPRCSPEIITTLFTGYTPIQTNKLKKKKKKSSPWEVIFNLTCGQVLMLLKVSPPLRSPP